MSIKLPSKEEAMVMRSGVNEGTIPRWISTFGIKQYFDNTIGDIIYSLLPKVQESTFQ